MNWHFNRRQLMLGGLVTALEIKATAQDKPRQVAPATEPPFPSSHWQNTLSLTYLIGKGMYRVWGLDIYQASLWCSESRLHPEKWHTQRLALELRYARAFKGKDIAQRSIDEMNQQQALSMEKSQAWFKILEQLFPDVQKGQTLTGIYTPTEHTQFLFDDQPLGQVTDIELSRRFFAIWLSPQTSAKGLRKALFGNSLQSE